MSTIQRITSPYKLDYENTKIDLNRESEAMKEVYRKDGFGLLLSMAVEFNSDNVIVEILIDDELVLSIDCEDISRSGNDFKSGFSEGLEFESSRDILKFKPTFPVMYRTSLVVRAKANGNSSSRDFERILVERTEEGTV